MTEGLWLLQAEGAVSGPYSLAALREMNGAGGIPASSLVANASAPSSWIPIAAILAERAPLTANAGYVAPPKPSEEIRNALASPTIGADPNREIEDKLYETLRSAQKPKRNAAGFEAPKRARTAPVRGSWKTFLIFTVVAASIAAFVFIRKRGDSANSGTSPSAERRRPPNVGDSGRILSPSPSFEPTPLPVATFRPVRPPSGVGPNASLPPLKKEERKTAPPEKSAAFRPVDSKAVVKDARSVLEPPAQAPGRADSDENALANPPDHSADLDDRNEFGEKRMRRRRPGTLAPVPAPAMGALPIPPVAPLSSEDPERNPETRD